MRLSRIDDSNRPDHARLTPEDDCYYLFEYTSGRNYSFSATNSRIANLKKRPSVASPAEMQHKARAIRQCANDFRAALSPAWLEGATLVPVPSSKVRGHPDHDDRMEQVARAIAPGVDVRPLVIQTASTPASHEAQAGSRVTLEELLEVYEIDEALAGPAPRRIAVIDDVLTAGTHFRAVETVLSRRFPQVAIAGLFVARRVFPTPVEAD